MPVPRLSNPRQPLRAPWIALLLGSCSGAGIGWQGLPRGELRDYQAAFAHDAGRRFVASVAADEWVQLARKVRVVWLGDHHRHEALHVCQRELLQRLRAAGVPLCFGLEAIGSEDLPEVDAFLAGECELDQLAARIRRRWPGSWLDAADVDREHYRHLLALARATGSPVFALEPTPRVPLERRDPLIAGSVRAAAQRYPDRLLVVVVGQAHLLGAGRLARRTGLPDLLLGAEPPPPLLQPAPPGTPAHGLACSDGGLWFFADLLPPPG